MIDPIGPTQLQALSHGTLHYRRYMSVGTIGKWILLQRVQLWGLSDCGHYRGGPDPIAEI